MTMSESFWVRREKQDYQRAVRHGFTGSYTDFLEREIIWATKLQITQLALVLVLIIILAR